MVNRRVPIVNIDLTPDSISYLLSFSILIIVLNFRSSSSDSGSPCGATLAASRAFLAAKFPSILAFWRIVLLLLLTTHFSQACSYESCAEEFTKGVKERKVHFGSNLVTCLLLRDYNMCLNASSISCRGDLRYKVLQQIASRYYDVDFECKDIIEKYEIENQNVVLPTGTMPPVTKQNDQCLFPYKNMNAAERSNRNSAVESDFRFCSAFGDPHIRTFGGRHDTCKIADAWPLVDNAFLNIQIVSAPIADGVEATAITKISIIIKALPGCTEQKTYTATQDNLPSYFDDGTIHSGEPSTSNGDSFAYPYRDGSDSRKRRAPPVLFIETLKPGYQVRLQLRYASTRVVVRRSGERSSLSVAIKMPEEALAQESFMSPWQLCLSSCSPGEKINYTEALKNPTRYFESLATKQPWPNGRPPSFMARDVAAAICRAALLADFFFDACVFDLMMSGGDASYRDAARDALDDIRSMYPVYGRHYETNRSDLAPYLSTVGQQEKPATAASVDFSRTSSAYGASGIFRTLLFVSVFILWRQH